jgi:hypothetical protein
MRPIFIYHYESEILRRKDEFIEMFERDGGKWEQLYLSEHPTALEDPALQMRRGSA